MLILYHTDSYQHQFCGGKKAVKALLSEKWAALHYAPARFSNQIKESQIQWTPRHLALHNVCRNHFSSKLSLHCLPADTNFWFYCEAKNWLKIGKSKSKWDVAVYYIYYNKAHKWKAMVFWVSHQCHQTYLCAAWKGRQPLDKAQSLIVICFPLCLPSFYYLGSLGWICYHKTRHATTMVQGDWQ